jgi:hypothetical protein
VKKTFTISHTVVHTTFSVFSVYSVFFVVKSIFYNGTPKLMPVFLVFLRYI